MGKSTLDRLTPTAPSQPRTAAVVERERGQLTRLERVIDVLYALALFQTITLLPQPTAAELERYGGLAQGMWQARDEFLMPLVGIALVLIYWGQNNLLFGNLDRTDGRHAASAVIQVAFVMMFGYFIRMGISVGDRPDILAAQSVCLLLAGAAAIAGWRYAQSRQLLDEDGLSTAEVRALGQRIAVEPTVAAVTIPIAWLGPRAYTLTFLLGIPVVAWIFRLLASDGPDKETRA
jgi:uncharacterized membrane protein